MKDSEFIELLNLYLDHEINAADAARLEAEVQGDPARRKIYQQYCRMQKACKVLAEDFQAGTATVPEPVIDFSSVPQRSRTGRFYTIGTAVAAAACVAIILVGRSRQQPAESAISPAIAATAPAMEPASPEVSGPAPRSLAHMVSMPVPMMQASDPALEPEQLYLLRSARSNALIRGTSEEVTAQFAWMKEVQLSPLQQPRVQQLEALRFEAQPASLGTESRTYGSRKHHGDPQIEMTAFRFQR